MKIQTLLMACAISVAPAAWAHNCPVLIGQIDEIITAKPDLDEETIVDEDSNKSVKQLRDQGEALHKAGQHDEAVETLQKALKMLDEQAG